MYPQVIEEWRVSGQLSGERNGIAQCWTDQKSTTITNAVDVRPVSVSRCGST